MHLVEVSNGKAELPIEDLGRREEGKRTFVYEDETQVVAGGVFFVDFAERGGEVEAA